MARDICRDCEEHFPEGEGLKDGICPACRATRKKLHGKAEAEPASTGEKKEE